MAPPCRLIFPSFLLEPTWFLVPSIESFPRAELADVSILFFSSRGNVCLQLKLEWNSLLLSAQRVSSTEASGPASPPQRGPEKEETADG